MKMTIREVMDKLRDISNAVQMVDKLMPDDRAAYIDISPKDQVMDLLEEYANMIKDTKVDI